MFNNILKYKIRVKVQGLKFAFKHSFRELRFSVIKFIIFVWK